MSEPIGPGDWVECINPTGRAPYYVGWEGHSSPDELGVLVAGALYFVTDVGVGFPSGEGLLWLRGVPESIEGGFCAWRFRPIRDGQERIVKKERVSA